MGSAIRGWRVGVWRYPTPAHIPDGVLCGLILAYRHKAEAAAVARFHYFVIEAERPRIHERTRVKRWGVGEWHRCEAYRHLMNFWYHQSRLVVLWAERCRRVAAGNAASCLVEL